MRLRARARPNLFAQHDRNHMSGLKGVKNCQLDVLSGRGIHVGHVGGKEKVSIGFGAPARVQTMYYRYRASERVIEGRKVRRIKKKKKFFFFI